MSAFLSIMPESCLSVAADMRSVTGTETENACQTDTNRDVTPQAAFAPLITASSMLGKWQVSQQKCTDTHGFLAQHDFGDREARNAFGEGMK